MRHAASVQWARQTRARPATHEKLPSSITLSASNLRRRSLSADWGWAEIPDGPALQRSSCSGGCGPGASKFPDAFRVAVAAGRLHVSVSSSEMCPTGKVSVLFLCLFCLFKGKKDKKAKKGQRHLWLLKPSWFTIQVAFYFLKTVKRQISFSIVRFSFQKTVCLFKAQLVYFKRQ